MLLLLCEVYYLLMILVCFYLKIDYSTRFSIIKLSKKKCDSKQDFKDEDFEPLCVIIKTIDFLEGYNMIYFDNSATTIPYAEALRTYQEVASKIFGNPSSLHNLGTKASRILEASRKQIADLLGVKSNEILFTSGGTESDNWVIKGVAFEKERYGKHIIVSDIEHPAVKESAKWLSQHGFEVSYAPVTSQGFVDLDQLAALLRPDTILVSVMAVNNEIGAIQPI